MKQWVRHTAVLFLIALIAGYTQSFAFAQEDSPPMPEQPPPTHLVALGDSWTALAYRFHSTPRELIALNKTINLDRQPAVGTEITLPVTAEAERFGRFLRPSAGGTLELALCSNRSPWALALQNDLRSPYSPLLYTPIILEEKTSTLLELPFGVETLEMAPGTLTPGTALALHARTDEEALPAISLEGEPLVVTPQEEQITALGGTGAFYPPGQHLLQIQFENQPLWEQPVIIADRFWNWEEVNYTNPDVLDQEAIRLERERLQTLWDEATPEALWQGAFTEPLEHYVEISSYYGARRSVSGGPYATYHEGTDFSAYGGTPVLAPAAGVVVLAEELAIRGGAVILDHGLGLHSGYYHLSAIHVEPGQKVEAGDLLGEVGTTGRSTGNHLHWDLLIGRMWIDALGWLEGGVDEWLIGGE
ncbi:MAG: peptidoglycan DD-metalloendopeptidase family protein [Candidatus Promineifilaceae bacterium]